MGNHTRTALAVLPEIGLNVGYEATPRMNIYTKRTPDARVCDHDGAAFGGYIWG
jgi:hypothetical protein